MIQTKLEELTPAKLRNQVLTLEEFKEYLKNHTSLKEQIATLLYFQWEYASDVLDETNDNDFKTVYDEERLTFLSNLVYKKLQALDQQGETLNDPVLNEILNEGHDRFFF